MVTKALSSAVIAPVVASREDVAAEVLYETAQLITADANANSPSIHRDPVCHKGNCLRSPSN